MSKGFLSLLGLVIVAGLSIGTLYSRMSASPAPASVAQVAATGAGAARPAFVAGPAAGGTPAPGAADRRMVNGDVERIDEQSITIQTSNGLLQVALTDQTTYQKITDGTLAALKVGDTVSVRGDSAGDGAVTATSLQVMAAGGQTGPAGFPGRTGQDGVGGGGPGQGGFSGARPGAGTAGGLRQGQPGQPDQAGPGNMLFGSIQSIDGQTLTLTTLKGSVTVTLAESAQIRQTVAASRTEVAAGQAITVVGQGAPDGTIRALAVTITTS
ncbi:MAG TPA: DUF5666 domain-containing protein [Chloroflexota bacterium]|nr:DUF5666 domain-containing protein [Chloroflexota bacterium]